MIKKLATVLFSVWLVGCATTDEPRMGPEITVTPVRYQLQLTTTDKQQAKQQWQSFAEKYANKLKGKTVQLTWYSASGREFINQLPRNMGYSVTISRGGAQKSSFDLKAEFVHSQVQVGRCQPDRMGHFSNEVGCFSENARWQSMVNPQNAL